MASAMKTPLGDRSRFQVSAAGSKALDFCFLSRAVGTCCFIFILYLNTGMRPPARALHCTEDGGRRHGAGLRCPPLQPSARTAEEAPGEGGYVAGGAGHLD